MEPDEVKKPLALTARLCVYQGTASEAVLVGLIAARKKSLKRLGLEGDASALAKLTVYCTSQVRLVFQKLKQYSYPYPTTTKISRSTFLLRLRPTPPSRRHVWSLVSISIT
jgi:hypothetical protein